MYVAPAAIATQQTMPTTMPANAPGSSMAPAHGQHMVSTRPAHGQLLGLDAIAAAQMMPTSMLANVPMKEYASMS